MNSDTLFLSSDSAEFKENIDMLMARGAPSLSSIEPVDYVKRCRRLWKHARTDALYSRRLLRDKIISGEGDELYCMVFAEINVETDSTGTTWKEPRDYLSRRKPLGPRRYEFICVYPAGALRPEPNEPEISIQLVALFDVLGFESMITNTTLQELHRKYLALIHDTFVPSVAPDNYSRAVGMFAGALREGYLKLPIHYAYFSDSLLLWAPYHNAFVGTFLDRCSSLFCNALSSSIPLRGAISVGETILHKKSNTYLGMPLLEATRLEKAQETMGVGLCNSCCSISFPPDRVMRYDPPIKALKPGTKSPLSGLVLDWPRHWADFRRDFPIDKINSIKDINFAKYYDNAVSFVQHSERNRDWFVKEVEKQIGPFKKANPV